jgi:hypothetical protein
MISCIHEGRREEVVELLARRNEGLGLESREGGQICKVKLLLWLLFIITVWL